MKIAITGSFDPITLGHQWLIKEAEKISSNVCIILAFNPEKTGFLPISVRKKLIEEITGKTVYLCEKDFLVEYCEELGVTHLLRGIRNAQDLEYERTINVMNQRINPKVQTLFVQPPEELAVLSSSLVRSFVGLNNWTEQTKNLVHPLVLKELELRYWVNSPLMPNCLSLDERIKLVEQMRSGDRAYHTLQHWGELWNSVQQAAKKYPIHGQSLEILKILVVFHDIIYNPQSKTNEEDSVEYFKKFRKWFEFDDTSLNIIVSTILATKNHLNNHQNVATLGKLFLDLDMAILATPNAKRLQSYAEQIREEFKMYPDDIYNLHRKQFLNSLLGKRIFNHSSQPEMEKQAQKNLQTLISQIKD